MRGKPNILLVMVDQMNAQVTAALGHPAVKTPHLDSLCSRGVTFPNAHTNSPLCVPARAGFMTGRMPSSLGVFDNGAELPASVPTVAHHAARGGYRTALAGKMHFVGPDQHHGFGERLTGDISLPGFTLTPDWRRGAYPNEGTSAGRLLGPQVVDWTLQLSFDEEVVETSLAFLRRCRREEQPFFLVTSLSHPHDPFSVTRELWEGYEGVEIPAPRVPAPPAGELHEFDRWLNIHHEIDTYAPNLTPEVVAANRRAYYAMVSYVDGQVGRLLAELERLDLAEDTWVVFTSDHGEMLGEHGLWYKRTYYDGAVKVPLIICPPGATTGRTDTRNVSLLDLAATIVEMSGAPDGDEWIGHMHGDSLLPLLHDSAAPWHDEVQGEYLAEGTLEPMFYLRRGRWKYVHVHRFEPRLFDLEADPDERNDLAGDPGHRQVRDELAARLLHDLDPAALKGRILQSQRERLAILETGPERRAWSHLPVSDPMKNY